MSVAISSRSPAPASTFPLGTRSSSTAATEADGKEGDASASSSVKADFLKFARMSPEERVQQAVLSKLGMTEEQFNKLDAKAKGDVLAKVRDEILRQMDTKGGRRTGTVADIKV
ncbi:hypothetical protein AB6806_25720 [Bosea sp. RCC_152_1]|uniref:hypothetical protein n=1 Tax=Bosea sp. RCC_152_1 TaxID=3239228 RepID=UPI000DD59013